MSTWPNTPAGATVLLDYDMNKSTLASAGLQDVYGTAIAGTDATAPKSPSSVIISRISAGNSNGGIQLHYTAPQSYTDFFTAISWRSNAGFQGRQVSNKLFFVRGPAYNGFFGWGTGGNVADGEPLVFCFNSGGLDNSHITGSTDPGTFLFPNVGSGMLFRDTWHTTEVYAKKSTTNTSRDGLIRWYVDGVMAGNYAGVNMAGNGLNEWVWAETWDGTVNPVPSVDWEYVLDHLFVATGGTPSGGGTATPTLQTLIPGTLSLAPGNSQSLTAGMSAAVSAAVTIQLVSSSPTVATVPANAIIGSGQSSTSFQVTAVAAGSTTVSATLGSNTRQSTVTVTSSGGGGTGPSDATYSYASQFSGTQGQNQWSYRDTAGNLLTFNGSNQIWERSGAPYLGIWNSGFHPATAAGAVLRWTAPGAGSARVTGSVRDYAIEGGNGVTFSVKHGTTTLFTQDIGSADSTSYPYDVTQTVATGEFIDFVLDPKGSIDYDSTQLNPVIVFTAAGGATNPEAPTLSSFTPANGVIGSSITITGTGFNATPVNNTVTLSGVPLPVTSASTTQLVVTVASGAVTGALVVTTSNGSATSATNYTVDNPETPVTPPSSNFGGSAMLLLVLP